MTKIENPKVFISYAWNDKEYQDKVLSFANTLIEFGVDVILDKYDLKEGQDTYTFMEKSVNDRSVTNVLLLIDPTYEKKANERQGGVGTETQIISPEVYEKTGQTKFIPIIFERHSDNSVPKPNYLKSRYHIDLSISDTYDDELRKLVRRLFGLEAYTKPQLGKKPLWLDQEIEPKEIIRITKYEEIKKIANDTDRLIKFKEECNNFKKELISYSSTDNDCISVYDGMQSLKKDFLSLVQLIIYVPQSINSIANLFESIFNEYQDNHTVTAQIKLSLLHELFLYTVAFCLKNEDYKPLGYLLNHSYYSKNSLNDLESFRIFYYSNKNLNSAMSLKDNSDYQSGTAQYWMDTLDSEFCSKQELIYADVFCFNVSLFNANSHWFPLTYIYDLYNPRSLMKKFLLGLKSRERLTNVVEVFGCNSVNEFVDVFEKLSKDEQVRDRIHSTRYPYVFESPDNMFDADDIVKVDELGTLN